MEAITDIEAHYSRLTDIELGNKERYVRGSPRAWRNESLCSISSERAFFRGGSVNVRHNDRFSACNYHDHDFFELIYMFKGSLTNFVEGTELRLREGSFCLLPPEVFHSLSCDEEELAINILFKTTDMAALLGGLLDASGVIPEFFRAALSSEDFPKYLMIDPDATLSACAERIILYMLNKPDGESGAVYDAAASAVLRELFCEAVLRGVHAEASAEKCSTTAFRQFVSYVYGNYKTLTLRAAAEKLGCSQSYACRQIKKHTGRSFSALINDLKMAEVCEQLRNTDKRIKSIASDAGYITPEHFNRTFRKYYGMTASEYRSAVKQAE